MMKRNGFTLIELIITLIVMGVAAAIVIPGFQYVARSNRVTANTNDFVTALSLARSTAVTRGRRAILCQSDEFDASQAANRSCTGGTKWDLGFILWVDDNGDGATQPDEVVRVWQALDDNDGTDDADLGPVSDTASGFGSGSATRVTYTPTGRLNGPALMFRLQPGDCGGQDFARLISIPIGGRPSSKGNQKCV